MLKPILPMMCGCGGSSFSMINWYAMIFTGSPVIVSFTAPQLATNPRPRTVAPSAGERSSGPAGRPGPRVVRTPIAEGTALGAAALAFEAHDKRDVFRPGIEEIAPLRLTGLEAYAAAWMEMNAGRR